MLTFIDGDGKWQEVTLGREVASGQHLCGCWTLLAASVAPGFEYEDFAEPQRVHLLKRYLERTEQVAALTRSSV